LLLEQVEQLRPEHVHAEEAQVEARAQPRHDQLLLGDRRRGLLEDRVDLVERALAADEPSAHRAVGRELALARGLHGGDRRVLRHGHVHELARATRRAVRDVQVIADQVEERVIADEVAAAEHRVAVAARLRLRHEPHPGAERTAGLAVRGLVARADDDAELLDPGAGGLLEDDAERGLVSPSWSTSVCSGSDRWEGLAAVTSALRMGMWGAGTDGVDSTAGLRSRPRADSTAQGLVDDTTNPIERSIGL
jgi:hypothetical protein